MRATVKLATLKHSLGHKSNSARTTERYARFRPNYLGRAVQAIDAYFADLRKEFGHLVPDAVFNPMHASSVLVPKGGGPQRLEKLVGATGIEPVTPAMSTQLPSLKPAQIRATPMSCFPFRSALVHGNLGPTWGQPGAQATPAREILVFAF
jgi:hypothetical protein